MWTDFLPICKCLLLHIRENQVVGMFLRFCVCGEVAVGNHLACASLGATDVLHYIPFNKLQILPGPACLYY